MFASCRSDFVFAVTVIYTQNVQFTTYRTWLSLHPIISCGVAFTWGYHPGPAGLEEEPSLRARAGRPGLEGAGSQPSGWCEEQGRRSLPSLVPDVGSLPCLPAQGGHLGGTGLVKSTATRAMLPKTVYYSKPSGSTDLPPVLGC